MTQLNDAWQTYLGLDWTSFLAGQSTTGVTAVHTADNAVTNASEVVLAANANRKGMIIQNTDSTDAARITLDGTDATTTLGIQLKAGQALTFFKPFCPTTAIKAIREGTADTTITVVEFT